MASLIKGQKGRPIRCSGYLPILGEWPAGYTVTVKKCDKTHSSYSRQYRVARGYQLFDMPNSAAGLILLGLRLQKG